ncbi:AraC family ligand binding domain-containing protein [Photobacterium galatheae]|uniref:AraC family ligand binding domain-containing protein n=1 Tax=Photobacterium galatheae TaxID=1654360 RepID=UPI00202CBEA0|nr:AraC family ligand binding domain-containing protein [Photobacterium galatheae]MCM0148972.1 AraC family ligand binding domain-containing protein [Photobacterium galatheae]
MNQAIEYSQVEQAHLYVGSRRKNVTAYLIFIRQGIALIRLGKHEYTLTQGTGFWLPFDCLHALTVLPGCRFDKVQFSSRLHQPLCEQAGFITISPLLLALLDELRHTHASPQSNDSPENHLLAVVADQAVQFSPSTRQQCPALPSTLQSVLGEQLQGRTTIASEQVAPVETALGISIKELTACLLIREAQKLSRSGRKAEQIAKDLKCQLDHLQTLAQTLIGREF